MLFRSTMQKALAELEHRNLVVTLRTSGRVVTEDLNMIRETKNQLAKEQIDDFLKRMKALGFEREDILIMLKKETGGESA